MYKVLVTEEIDLLHSVPSAFCSIQLEFNLIIGVFPNWSELSLNSENQLNHLSMNKVHFKDPVYYMCLPGTEVP